MRVCLIGCVEFSQHALHKLFDLEARGICEVVGVVTRSSSQFNSDFVDIGETFIRAGRHQNKVHYHEDETGTLEFLNRIKPDVIYCFGWSALLRKPMLTVAFRGVIGFHPAKLPRNRGRHPIIWALALGLTETASTFFRMDEGADSGPILSQKTIQIAGHDNARSLYDKIVRVALDQIDEFTTLLARNGEQLEEQDHSIANYWRKRSAKDGLIDWRMEAGSIYNLVRALSPPYPGAEFHTNADRPVKVWKSTIATEPAASNLEPGKVLDTDNGRVLVKCGGETALWLEDFEPVLELKCGEYL